MPEYLPPGVYIEEIERGPRPIEGVPTSTAAFLGEAERGPITPAPGHQLQGLPALFGGVFGRRDVPAVRGQRLLRERRQALVRLPPRRRRRDASARRAFGNFIVLRALGPGAWGNRVFAQHHGRNDQGPQRRSRRLPPAAGLLGDDPGRLHAVRSVRRRRIARMLPRPTARGRLRRSRQPIENSPDFYGKRLGIDGMEPELRRSSSSCARGAQPERAPADGDWDALQRRRRRRSAGRRTTSPATRPAIEHRAGPGGARARPVPRSRARLRAVPARRRRHHLRASSGSLRDACASASP